MHICLQEIHIFSPGPNIWACHLPLSVPFISSPYLKLLFRVARLRVILHFRVIFLDNSVKLSAVLLEEVTNYSLTFQIAWECVS